MSNTAALIEKKISAALDVQQIEVIDESHQHEGHSGWKEGGETHFRVLVVSSAFEGKNQVQRQRLVYEVLKEEMKNAIHALALKTVTPAEIS